MKATIKFYHRISPDDKDIKGPFFIPDHILARMNQGNLDSLKLWYKREIGSPLGRLQEWRMTDDAKVYLFPSSSIWHCIAIEFQRETISVPLVMKRDGNVNKIASVKKAREAITKLADTLPICDRGAFSIHTPED